MSLDVYLTKTISVDFVECDTCASKSGSPLLCSGCVANRATIKALADELKEQGVDPGWVVLYEANITHNLNTMAQEACIYEALWRPEEIGATKASDIIQLLELGLAELVARPDYYKQFNSPNGWGMYKHFVPFVEEYLQACLDNPTATIEVSV